jgi:Glycosyl hydrolases family 16
MRISDNRLLQCVNVVVCGYWMCYTLLHTATTATAVAGAHYCHLHTVVAHSIEAHRRHLHTLPTFIHTHYIHRAFDGSQYTSAKVYSRGLSGFNQKYGRIESRAMFDNGQGLWPAIWLLPNANNAGSIYGAWPQSGEIDIFEGTNDLGVAHQTIHYGTQANHQVPLTSAVFCIASCCIVLCMPLQAGVEAAYKACRLLLSCSCPADKTAYGTVRLTAAFVLGGHAIACGCCCPLLWLLALYNLFRC